MEVLLRPLTALVVVLELLSVHSCVMGLYDGLEMDFLRTGSRSNSPARNTDDGRKCSGTTARGFTDTSGSHNGRETAK